MEERDLEEFSAVLGDVYALYGKECSRGVARLWWEALRGYTVREVRGALSAHITNADNGQFIPKPADVRRMLEGASDTRALQAWTKVDQAVRRVGPWESIIFDDSLIHAVLADMGGWTTLCQVTDEEWPFKRNEFAKRYQGYVTRSPQIYPRRLVGHFEHENGKNGHEITPPLLAGDPMKALTVYQRGSETKHRYPRLAAEFLKRLPSSSAKTLEPVDA